VYEWESEGEGGCVQSDGCVYPISDVAGGHESYFMDATPSGDNVFIWTRDQLVPSADGDTRANVYDVRVGGGFPVSVAPPACTNGDSCKGPVSPQPGVFGAPASATFSGEGNLAAPPAVLNAVKPRAKPKPKPKRCRKGFARKHGRCVKRTGRAHSKRVGGK
jgi:hypothetical protein